VETDNRTVEVRSFFIRRGLAAAAIVAVMLSYAAPASAFTAGAPCSDKSVTSPGGVGFRILFANNGAVEQYIVTAKADDPEAVNDARSALEATYGPAGINSPALKIISFRPGAAGGMMVPDKAIDSCGRLLTFN